MGNSTSKNYDDEVGYEGRWPQLVTQNKMKNKMHRLIGLITMFDSQNEKMYGTGILLSPNLVLTAAHNIFNFQNQEQYNSFRFYPHHHSKQIKDQGFYEVDKLWINPLYKKSNHTSYDIALMKLKTEVPQQQFIPLKAVTFIKQLEEIAIYGYPCSNHSTGVQMGLTLPRNKIIKIDEENSQIRHIISTEDGQSGSPLILIQPNQISIIGVHKGGGPEKDKFNKATYNVARLIDQDIMKILQEQAEKMQARSFAIAIEKGWFQKAQALLKQQKWEKAEYCYNLQFAYGRGYIKSYIGLGLALIKQHKYNEALQKVEIALNLINQNPKIRQFTLRVLRIKGYALSALGKHQEALACYQDILEKDPKNTEAHINLSSALNSLQRYKESRENLLKSEKYCQKKLEYWNNLGYSQSHILTEKNIQQLNPFDRYKKAIQVDLEDLNNQPEANDIKSENETPHINQGILFLKENRCKDAMDEFASVLRINPMNALAHNNMAVCEARSGQFYKAIKNMEQAIELCPSQKTYHDNYLKLVRSEKQKTIDLSFLATMMERHPENEQLKATAQELGYKKIR